jgi:hypothetical protein
MADLAGVGFTVNARAALGIADTSDAGQDPNRIPVAGTIVLKTTLAGPTTYLPDDTILLLPKVTCEFDEAGNLRPPADGVSLPIDPDGNLVLVSPQAEELLDREWTWTAEFIPVEGAGWSTFIISEITGAPGETVKLTTRMPTRPTGVIRQALVYLVDDLTDPLPAGVVPGDLLLETPTMTLGKVVA